MEVEEKSISEFRPQERNANKHTERGGAALEESIQEDGWIGAITVAADDEAFAGSDRLNKVVQVGMDTAIVIESDGSKPIIVRRTDIPSASDPRAKRLGIADNRVAQINLQWDEEVLSELTREDPELTAGLFTDKELAHVLREVGQDKPEAGQGGDEFDPAVVDGPARARRGDIWRIGPHYLMCGDSSDPDDVAALTRLAAPVDLLVTSPPYGVGKDYEEGGVAEWLDTIKRVFTQCAYITPLWFVNLGNRRTGNDGYEAHTFGMMVNEFEQLGARMLALRIWTKPPAWATPGPYWRHTYKPVDDYEFLAIFATEKPKHKERLNEDDATDWGYRGVWNFSSVHSANEVGHSAAFPIELPSRAIRLLTDPGATIYDPFAGTSTTMVAAHRLGRLSIMMEKSPAYCDVSLSRAVAEGVSPIERVTGKD